MDALLSGKQAGEPVPQVDPADIKAVWTIYADVARRHPGKQVAVGAGFITASCRPGADVSAVAYRTGMLQIMAAHPEGPVASWMENGEPDDALFRAAAQTKMEWVDETGREGLPFDINEFLGRARGEIT